MLVLSGGKAGENGKPSSNGNADSAGTKAKHGKKHAAKGGSGENFVGGDDVAAAGGKGSGGKSKVGGTGAASGKREDGQRLEGRVREISKKIVCGGALGKSYEALGLLESLVSRVKFVFFQYLLCLFCLWR